MLESPCLTFISFEAALPSRHEVNHVAEPLWTGNGVNQLSTSQDELGSEDCIGSTFTGCAPVSCYKVSHRFLGAQGSRQSKVCSPRRLGVRASQSWLCFKRLVPELLEGQLCCLDVGALCPNASLQHAGPEVVLGLRTFLCLWPGGVSDPSH